MALRTASRLIENFTVGASRAFASAPAKLEVPSFEFSALEPAISGKVRPSGPRPCMGIRPHKLLSFISS